jgi:acid phosphatase type 7
MDAHALGPITKGPWVQRVTDTIAVVRVEVNPPSPVTVELQLAPTTDGGRPSVTSSEVVTLHALTLKDLQPATRYSYSVRAGASTKFGSFVTAPAPDSDASFRFMVYGDNRNDDAAHASVVRSMVSNPSEFLVHTGDFVARGGSPTQWQTFFDIEAPLLSTRAHFSCVGNHELTDGPGVEYARYFGPTDIPLDPAKPKGAPAATKPEQLDGTFRWGSARFFLINGMVSYKATGDRAWFDKALADSDAEPGIKWRIVVVHHGPWSSGPHGGNTRLRDAGVVELMKAHKVDLIISGHDHIYERGWGDGLAFIVSGGGGAPLYNIKKAIPESRKVEATHHFVDIGVSPSALQVVAMRSDGSTLERCGLSKSAAGGWDCDGPSSANGEGGASGGSPTSAGSSSSGALTTPGSSTPRCGCDVVGAASKSWGWTAGLALAIGVCRVRRRRI